MRRIGADETQEKSAQMIAAHQSTENRLMSLRDALTATPSSTSLRVVVEALVQAWLTRKAAGEAQIDAAVYRLFGLGLGAAEIGMVEG